MDETPITLAQAARLAATNIVRLVEHVMNHSTGANRSAAFEEVQQTILALIAAVFSADGLTSSHERAFAGVIAKDLDDPERCHAYVQEYAARWHEIAQNTPGFFSVVLDYDVTNKTDISREVIRELKRLVHFAANADGERTADETGVAAALLARVDGLFREARWSVKWDEDSLPVIPLGATMRRDEFRNRETI